MNVNDLFKKYVNSDHYYSIQKITLVFGTNFLIMKAYNAHPSLKVVNDCKYQVINTTRLKKHR